MVKGSLINGDLCKNDQDNNGNSHNALGLAHIAFDISQRSTNPSL